MTSVIPPMVNGLPFLGSLLDWRRDHFSLFMRALQEYGPVFGVKLGPQRGVVLIGPRYHQFYFREVDQVYRCQSFTALWSQCLVTS
jgi:sterol 14-demethylase